MGLRGPAGTAWRASRRPDEGIGDRFTDLFLEAPRFAAGGEGPGDLIHHRWGTSDATVLQLRGPHLARGAHPRRVPGAGAGRRGPAPGGSGVLHRGAPRRPGPWRGPPAVGVLHFPRNA